MANACCRNLWLDTINTKTTVFPAGEEESHSKDDCHISTSGGGRSKLNRKQVNTKLVDMTASIDKIKTLIKKVSPI
ncbi:hypothetical protein T4E_820 [Trichinella pseudospiralis]|uniref:Uncharacterized protein n=1 Tax=Trichinella pseudospiralis TaxID=6337 RepID=A0A0V0XGQ6_TRIPS|nr:hypothetical protein T4E_695 [Trichinella pseudospiralis]KRX87197.1 hypothetical protein T4E_820 [Trichinella pseudospiralis]